MTPASLSKTAYEALLDDIVSGALRPGAALRDGDIAGRLGTSRTPVREALMRLADEGLVVIRPRASTVVAPVAAEDARQAFPVVAALHGLATRLGVAALGPADLEAMRRADDERTAALRAGDVREAIRADDRFHGVLVAAAGNRELAAALARLMPKIRRLDLLHFAAQADDSRPSAQHAALLEACATGDAERAAGLAERNFLILGAQVAELLEARS